jgi:hypothetical protein
LLVIIRILLSGFFYLDPFWIWLCRVGVHCSSYR